MIYTLENVFYVYEILCYACGSIDCCCLEKIKKQQKPKIKA